MNPPLLILDVNFLAHRSAFVLSRLQYEGESTEVAFGLLRDLLAWQEVFRTKRVAFCFDYGRNARCEIYPEYKSNRSPKTEEEEEVRRGIREQLNRLREEELYRLGYRNVFWQEGREADDVIASVAMNLPKSDEGVIVASDSDLYQLLSGNVRMYDPIKNKVKTLQWFRQTYGIVPSQWADVKAIAGCDGDNVKGIWGVGEKSALLFLKGLLEVGSNKHVRIVEGNDVWKRNLQLVQLPFAGTDRFDLREDRVTKERWLSFCFEKGMKSLRRALP